MTLGFHCVDAFAKSFHTPARRRWVAVGMASAVLACGLVCGAALPAAARSRIKDIVDFENVRENVLVGYGIVVGLSGTGDTMDNSPMTLQTLQAYANAMVFFEAVKRAGDDLSWDHLFKTIESIKDYDTGIYPPITFGPLPDGHFAASGSLPTLPWGFSVGPFCPRLPPCACSRAIVELLSWLITAGVTVAIGVAGRSAKSESASPTPGRLTRKGY